MTEIKKPVINLGTKSEIDATSSKALAGKLFASTDRFTIHIMDDNGDIQPLTVAIDDLATAATIDGSSDYVIIHDDSTGDERKALIDDIISATVLGTDLGTGSVTSTSLQVTSSTGTNATLPGATTSAAGLLTGADKTQLDATETSTELDARDTANRSRSNHTGTQAASTISDFDTEVANNSSVTANTAKVSADGDADSHADIYYGAPPTSGQYLLWNVGNASWTPSNFNTDVAANSAVTANTAKVSADGSINTHSDVDTTTTAPSSGDLLQYDGSDWVPSTKNWASLSCGVGLTGINSSYKVIYIDRIEDESNSGVHTLSSNEITINDDGAFLVCINIVFYDTTASDSQLEFKPEVYSGGSWSYLSSGGRVRSRFHVGNSVYVPINLSFIININSGDKLRFVVGRVSGTTTSARQVDNYTSCTINKI